MPINGKLIAGVVTEMKNSRRNRPIPTGVVIGKIDEATLVKQCAEAGQKAFSQGLLLGANPHNPLRERNQHNAWATGWKGMKVAMKGT